MSTTTVSGLIATTPRYLETQDGLKIISFRLAETGQVHPHSGSDAITNWYTVTGFGDLAEHASRSLNKGDRVFVNGILRIRDWDNGDRAGTSVEVEALHLGHDLLWGSTVFTRESLTVQERASQAETVAHSCNCQRCNR